MSASENVRAILGDGANYSKIVKIANVDELAEAIAEEIPGGTGEGTNDHSKLKNRDAAGSHPSTAVAHGTDSVSDVLESLKTSVASKADASAVNTALGKKADATALDAEIAARAEAVSDLQDQVDDKADASALSAETLARETTEAGLQDQITTLGQTKANSTDLGGMALVDDAPANGKPHARQDEAWVEVSSTGGVTNHGDLTGRDAAGSHPATAVSHGAGSVGSKLDSLDTAVAAKADASALAAETLARETDITGLTETLNFKAPLASPALTGAPTAPTAATGTFSEQIANTAFVQYTVATVVKRATATLTAANWTGSAAPWTQTVTMDNDVRGVVGLASGATLTEYEAAAAAGLWVSARTATTITVAAANEKPTIAIPFEYVGA